MGLAGLRQGTEYLKPTPQGGRRFTPFISWKDGDSKTVAFLTPIEQVAKVRMHDYVKVPADNEKGFRFDFFMCRRDPAWLEESGGECYLCDVLGHKANEKHTGMGIELEPLNATGTPQVTGLNVITKPYKREDGTEVEFAQWGLIRQSFGNFFNYFTAFGQKWGGINHLAFDIGRVGGDKNTSYVIMPLAGVELPDFSQYEIPDLVEVLEGMGSTEKYATLAGNDLDQSSDFGDSNTNTFQRAENTGPGIESKFEQLKKQLPGDLQGKVESFTG